jgi:phytoene dehydrogenase-like protein
MDWQRRSYDAVVVGSGPNGLSAAITLARQGLSVLVIEAQPTIGGGARSLELTLPGFVHDICSAIHPMAVATPFFRSLPLAEHGLEWIHPQAPLAHPFDDGAAVLLERSVEATAKGLGSDDEAYRRWMGPLVDRAKNLFSDLVAPPGIPRHLFTTMRFARHGLRSARAAAESLFTGKQARALFAGLAGHSILPLERRPSAAVGMMLQIAGHAVGWPLSRGGSQKISNALASYFRSLGGEIVSGRPIASVDELPEARAVLLDVTPRQVVQLAGHRLPAGYRRRLERFRYGPGVFKLDWALSSPIPWKAEVCSWAGTVHLGGTLEEIAESERLVWEDKIAEKPYVLVAQQSLFDPTRAPAGKHTAWAYCHVPHGCTIDVTDRIEAHLERFAPGFRDCILARHALSPADMQRHNANYLGGDITGGAQTLWQTFARPVLSLSPYATPNRGLYICSSSTPPGGGVHGMCGYFAARVALRREFEVREPQANL